MSKEAMKLALEALELEEAQTAYPNRWLTNAITALREALAEQPAPAQQEPGRNHYEDGDVFERIAAMKRRTAQQEPVAWYRDEDGIRMYYESKVWDDATPLYTKEKL